MFPVHVGRTISAQQLAQKTADVLEVKSAEPVLPVSALQYTARAYDDDSAAFREPR